MLLVVLLICVIVFIYVAIRRRDPLSLYFLGMSLSNIAMLGGVVVYIAQMGGIAATAKEFLFLSLELQRWLHHLPISMDKLGYVVAVGRTMFPFFLFMAALHISMIRWVRRKMRLLRLVAAVPTVLFLVYYFPKVFQPLVHGRFWLLKAMMPISMGWIVLCVVVSVLLMAQEYHATTIPMFKRNNGYMFLSAESMTVMYLIYATKDPAQIYNMFVGEYISLGITSYIGPSLSTMGWIILIILTIVFVALGSYGIVRYTQIDHNENKEDLRLQRKFDAAGMGISVFVHGIKNQLLSSQVLHKRLARALDAEDPDLNEVRSYAEKLRELNEGMSQRMDELYRTVKDNALSLAPVHADEIVKSAVSRFHGKYPDGTVKVQIDTDRFVLADLGSLSEALYNLMTNGYEAAVQAGREAPYVRIAVRPERLWTVFEVRDNGGGIPKNMQSKIFEPFYTSKNTNYNWGMGLYYVRKIVNSHFGHLRLESRPGEGSTFFVMLPLFDASAKGKGHG